MPRRLTTPSGSATPPALGPRQRPPLVESSEEQSSPEESVSAASTPPHSGDDESGFPDFGCSATDSDADSLNSEDHQQQLHEYAILEPDNFIHVEVDQLVVVEEVDNELESEQHIFTDMPCSASSSTCNGNAGDVSTSQVVPKTNMCVTEERRGSTTSNINRGAGGRRTTDVTTVSAVNNDALDLEDEEELPPIPIRTGSNAPPPPPPHKSRQPSSASVANNNENVSTPTPITTRILTTSEEEEEEEEEEGYVEVEHEFTHNNNDSNNVIEDDEQTIREEEDHRRLSQASSTTSTEAEERLMLPPSVLPPNDVGGNMIRVNSCQQLLQEDEEQFSDNETNIRPLEAAIVLSTADENVDNTRRGSASARNNGGGRSRSDLYESIFLPMNGNPPYSRECSNNSSTNGDLTPNSDGIHGWNAQNLMEYQEGHTPSHHRGVAMKKISSAPMSNSPDTIQLFTTNQNSLSSSFDSRTGTNVVDGTDSIGSQYPGGARPRSSNSNKINFVQPVGVSPQRENWVEFDDSPLVVPPLNLTNNIGSNANSAATANNKRLISNDPNNSILLNTTSTFEEKFATPRLADLESSRILPAGSTSSSAKSGLTSSSAPSLSALQPQQQHTGGARPRVNPNQITSRTDIPFQKNPTNSTSANNKKENSRMPGELTTSNSTNAVNNGAGSNKRSSEKKQTMVNLLDEFPPFTTVTTTVANSAAQQPRTSTSVVQCVATTITTTTTSNKQGTSTVTTVVNSTRTRSSTTSTPSSSSGAKLSKASSQNSISSTAGDSSTSQRNKEGRRSMRSKRSSRRKSVSSVTSSSSSVTTASSSNNVQQPTASTVPPTPPTTTASGVARVTSIETETVEGASQSQQHEVPPPLPPRETNPKRIFDATDSGGAGGKTGSSSKGPSTGGGSSRSKPEIAPHRSSHNRGVEGAQNSSASLAGGSSSGLTPRNSNSRSSSKGASGGPRRTPKMMNQITTGGGATRGPGDRPPPRVNGELPSSKILIFFCIVYFGVFFALFIFLLLFYESTNHLISRFKHLTL